MQNNLFIIARLQGGLGNQLFQYAAGRALSVKLQRLLLLDPRTISPEAPARHYDLGSVCVDEPFVNGHLAWMTRWVGSVRLGNTFQRVYPLSRSFRYLRDREQGFQPEIFEENPGPIVLFGYWQSFRYFSEITDELRQSLQFRHAPDAGNKAKLDELMAVESVAVHIRRGDYVSNSSFAANLGACDQAYYRKAVDALQTKIQAPRFYVFTDDPAWARSDLDLGVPFEVVDHNLGRADYEDMRLMSNCQHLIIANSSFSWWSAWLANRPGKLVYAPARWFLTGGGPIDDRLPVDWIRI